MTSTRQVSAPILLGQALAGEQLAAANRVLRWHGCVEIGPCKVGEVLERLNGMELGRATHILNELAEALGDGKDQHGR